MKDDNYIETFGVWKKVKEKCEAILIVAGELNPGSLALATSGLTTEIRQPTTKTFTFYFYTFE